MKTITIPKELKKTHKKELQEMSLARLSLLADNGDEEAREIFQERFDQIMSMGDPIEE